MTTGTRTSQGWLIALVIWGLPVPVPVPVLAAETLIRVCVLAEFVGRLTTRAAALRPSGGRAASRRCSDRYRPGRRPGGCSVKRLLIPVDGSESSQRAVSHLIEMARCREPVAIVLLNVVEAPDS